MADELRIVTARQHMLGTPCINLDSAPQRIRKQAADHARSREPGRQRLIQELEHNAEKCLAEYDNATHTYERDLLQVYEMLLQSGGSELRAEKYQERNR